VVKPPYERLAIEIMKYAMMHNFYRSITQAATAYYAARAMGGLKWLREQYALEDVKGLKSAALVAALAAASIGVIFGFQYTSTYASGNPEAYISTWRRVMRELPPWSKA